MLDWIFEGAANWVASIMSQLMDAVSGLFLEALGTDMTAMEEYFPFAVSAYTVIQYTAWALLFLIVAWQLFRAFGGPLTEAESPLQLLARGSIFAVLIAFAKPIFSLLLDIARAPYTALMDASMDPGDFTFAGIEQVLRNGLVTIISVASVVGLILLIILMIALAWNYFKLLLETVERYVLVGVLCYTSPLAYAMGASKATSRVFQSWCRMVGSQLLLLVLNVWFLRAFNSSVGQFVANGGALTSGRGSVFLWLFCALALLKIAQKCDSYLAALGLSVAQTGSSMGIEMLMAARAITGFSRGGGGSAASVFGGRGGTPAGGAAGGGAAAGGVFSGFVSRYKPNSFVRDAVVDGGARMGAGGGVGFVGRVFGGMAARNGATLTAESISSVASRPAKVAGAIAGDIADRSLPNYMPQMAAGATGGMSYSNTQITGGHISTVATGPDGKQSNVDLFSTSQYERPETPHKVVQAADGSQWYQVASGDGMGAFYSTPAFNGDISEAAQVSETFPSAPADTVLRTVDDGTLEASYPDGSNALWYNSAFYQEPDAPHEVIQGADGLNWYAMTPHAAPPAFEAGEAAAAFNRAQFQQFMPGYEQQVVSVDDSRASDGVLEVRHADGSGTAFYDRTMYQAPRGDYHVFEDSGGSQWYAIPGTAAVERRPVYEDGKPVYDKDVLRTVNVETVRYPTTPTRFADTPGRRPTGDRKPPKRKNCFPARTPAMACGPILSRKEVGFMSDDQQRFGDGQDDYLKGAQKAAEAARKAGGTAAKTAGTAAAGEATANAAAAVTQAGAEAGKAAANIAAGTAAGGPWGAILSAAWSLRHTLFKVLIFICLFLLFIVVAVVSLPSIVFNNIFQTDPSSVDPNAPTSITANFDDVSSVVSDCIKGGYDMALAEVENIITTGGYDHELSMEALINNGLISTDYDTCYTLAAYSASMQQRGTTKADMKSKLDAVAGQMFAVTYEVKETTKTVQPEAAEGEEPGEPEEITVQYVVCTIHPFDQSVILTAFGIDTSAQYDQFGITYGEAITNMSNALKMTMYGTLSNGMVPPITDAELNAYLDSLTCSGTRKELMRVALSLVGRVPYFWGGKSAPGWNEAWNTPRLVTAAGSSSTGTIRPYGLDCSGYTEWVYQTALGVTLYDGTWNQWDATYAITEAELLPGDLGFMAVPGTVPVNHVLLYAGKDADGNQLWVHCSSGAGGVALNSPDYVTQFRRRKDIDLEADFTPATIEQGANND